MFGRSSLLLAALLLASCDEAENRPTDADREPAQARPGDARSVENATQPDNTARNKGDASSSAVTPFDQGESADDIRITAEIRRGILRMEGMSTNADNVKIITRDGAVVLRGVVESQSEADAIANLAKQAPGVTQVDNQLQVDPN